MKRMKKTSAKACSITLATAMTIVSALGNGVTLNVQAQEDRSDSIQLSDADIASLSDNTDYTFSRDSVHDPSVVDGKNGYYYVFGSHMAVSKTSDLMNWTNVTSESTTSNLFGTVDSEGNVTQVSYDEAFRTNATTTVTALVDGKETQISFGNFDASAWNTARDSYTVSGNMWAPDVVYNDTMQKWCMYLSLNGSKWNSSIILLTADDIEGPYVYQGPVIYSGFSGTVEECSYENSDLEIVLGDLDELPEKYNKADNSTWGEYWPHAIDPCVFYDAEGDLWMSYGSWSGGIYMIELDEETGLRDYTVTYESDYEEKGKSVTTDEYFGTKIAGGYYVSGEGSYIQQIGDYYYLFMSYGFYSPSGGYNMRVFRSKNPDGPYVDTDGTSAIYSSYSLNYSSANGNVKDTRGEKIMGNYQWNTMSVAEVSQGHNSVVVDSDGRAFLVYHTKFNDGTAGHALRVHEIFVNEDGWLVVSPYEYTNYTQLSYTTEPDTSDITGDYDVLVMDYAVGGSGTDYVMDVATPVSLTLNADGTVTGKYSGTWAVKSGTPYATITLDGNEYKGVFTKQRIDSTGVETMCFSIVDESTGLNIWGSNNSSDANIVALNVTTCDVTVPDRTYTDITLPTEGTQGATISWSSSNETVLSSEGKIGTVESDTTVTLTKTVSKGNYYYEKAYTVLVCPAQNKEESFLIASYYEDETVDLSKCMDGSVYVRNPYCSSVSTGLDISGGVTISFDVVPTGDLHALGTILGFGDSGKLYFTPASYLGYNAGGYYFDANMKNYATVTDYIGNAYALTKTAVNVKLVFLSNGYEVYINDEKAYDQSIEDTDNGAGTLVNYSKLLTWLQESPEKVYLGYGAWWSAAGYDEANINLSNLKFYVNAIEEEDSDSAPYQHFTLDELTITSNDYIDIIDNPFYGKTIENLDVKYTINFADSAAKNGWDGIFAFYKSSTGGRVSFQTAPYICYNVGSWTDLKALSGTDMYAYSQMTRGTDYEVELIVTESGAKFLVDGTEIAITVAGGEDAYSSILEFISNCDQFSWGVGKAQTAYWYTELCTLSNVDIAINADISETESDDASEDTEDEETATSSVSDVNVTTNDNVTTMSVDEVNIVDATFIQKTDNPFNGKDIESMSIEYTINMSSQAAKNGWDGIFAFYDTNGSGRVSIQTAPYICYNDYAGNWIDINNPNLEGANDVAPGFEAGTEHTVKLTINSDEIHMYVDDSEISFAINGSGATYSDMLSFISSCGGFSFGVGQATTSFWNTELCTLTNLKISVTSKAEDNEETTGDEEENTGDESETVEDEETTDSDETTGDEEESADEEEITAEETEASDEETETEVTEAVVEVHVETEQERADRLYNEAVEKDEAVLETNLVPTSIAGNAFIAADVEGNEAAIVYDMTVVTTDYGYNKLINKTLAKLIADKKDETTAFYVGSFTYLNNNALLKLSNLSMDTNVIFDYQGMKLELTIPANTDVAKYTDKYGYAGLCYLGSELGTLRFISR